MSFPNPSISEKSRQFLSKPFIQKNIIEGWTICQRNLAYAAPNLANWFRKNRSLGSRDRKVVSEVLYTLIRFEDWFEYYQLSQIPDRLEFLQGVHNITPDTQLPRNKALAIHLSVPQWMADQWEQQLLGQSADFCTHLQQRAPLDIRCNIAKISRAQLQRKLQQKDIEAELIPNTTSGLRILKATNLQNDPLFKQGLFEIQDASSQLFCEHIPIQNNSKILDLCAGAGGKSLAMANLGAQVWVNEPRSHALEELQKRAQRANVSFKYHLPKKPMDIVMVDAPCSGSGRLRREPTIRWKWQLEEPLQWVQLQQELLQEATQYVNENGIIAYATCSLLEEENSHTLEGWDCERQYLWPHQYNCDGFSWSIYRKRKI